jgi:SAM-dependent methyltransferase
MGSKRWDFLILQVNKSGFKTGVEIGLKAGRTTYETLRACPKLSMTGIDPWIEQDTGQIDADGKHHPYSGSGWTQSNHNKSEKTARQKLAQFGKRANIIKGFSSDAAIDFEDNSLDFVFIDGDHSYDGCKGDICSWLRKIRPGGLICGHDINWPGVRQAVEEHFVEYETDVDNVWYVTK